MGGSHDQHFPRRGNIGSQILTKKKKYDSRVIETFTENLLNQVILLEDLGHMTMNFCIRRHTNSYTHQAKKSF